jgi:hypothetical protein
MELWHVFAALGVICFCVGLFKATVDRSQQQSRRAKAVRPGEQGVQLMNSTRLPVEWNEAAIAREIADLRGKPIQTITHNVNSLIERWVWNQDSKTSAARTRFIRQQLESKLEYLRQTIQGQELWNRLELMPLEHEKKKLEATLATEQLKIRSESQTRLNRLESEHKELELRLKIAELKAQIDKVSNPPKPEPPIQPPTVSEQIAAQQGLNQQMETDQRDELAAILKGRTFEQLTPREQDRYAQAENSWDEKIEAGRERLRQLKQRRRPNA